MLQPKSFYRVLLINSELEKFEQSLMVLGEEAPNLVTCLIKINRLLKERKITELKVSEIEEISENYEAFLKHLPKSCITQKELDRYNKIKVPLNNFLTERITYKKFIELTKENGI